MKPDSMLVEPEHIVGARKDVADQGSGKALNDFAQREPALASFIYEGLASIAGKLSLSGAPTELVQGCHEDVLAVILTCVHAMRRGHYALWKDTVTDTRLAQLDASFQSKPRRRRKKHETKGTEHEEVAEAPASSAKLGREAMPSPFRDRKAAWTTQRKS